MNYLKSHTVFNHTLGTSRARRAYRQVMVRESALFYFFDKAFFLLNMGLSITLMYYLISFGNVSGVWSGKVFHETATVKKIVCFSSLRPQCKILAFQESYDLNLVVSAALDIIQSEDKEHFRMQSHAFYETLKNFEMTQKKTLSVQGLFAEGALRKAAADVLSIIGTQDV